MHFVAFVLLIWLIVLASRYHLSWHCVINNINLSKKNINYTKCFPISCLLVRSVYQAQSVRSVFTHQQKYNLNQSNPNIPEPEENGRSRSKNCRTVVKWRTSFGWTRTRTNVMQTIYRSLCCHNWRRTLVMVRLDLYKIW